MRRSVGVGVGLGLRIEWAEDRELQKRRALGQERPGPLRASPAASARAARCCTRRAPPRSVPSRPRARRSNAVVRRRKPHLPHSTRSAPAARWCVFNRSRRARPPCVNAAPHGRERIGHRIEHAPLPLQHDERGQRAGVRVAGCAVRRCNEIVRSVRSETLFANDSFCRSEPTARLSSSCFSMNGIGAALQRDGLADLADVRVQPRDVAHRRQRAPVDRGRRSSPRCRASGKTSRAQLTRRRSHGTGSRGCSGLERCRCVRRRGFAGESPVRASCTRTPSHTPCGRVRRCRGSAGTG